MELNAKVPWVYRDVVGTAPQKHDFAVYRQTITEYYVSYSDESRFEGSMISVHLQS